MDTEPGVVAVAAVLFVVGFVAVRSFGDATDLRAAREVLTVERSVVPQRVTFESGFDAPEQSPRNRVGSPSDDAILLLLVARKTIEVEARRVYVQL